MFAAVQLSTKGEKVFLGIGTPQDTATELISESSGANAEFNLFGDETFNDETNEIAKTSGLPAHESVLPSHFRLVTFLALVLE